MTDLRLYIRSLIRDWWIIALTILSAVTAAMLLIYYVTPVYRATTSFIISPSPEELSRDFVTTLSPLSSRTLMPTYAEILNSVVIGESAATRIQLPLEDLGKYQYLAVVIPDANVIELSVTGPDPVIAANLANEIALQGIDYISQLYTIFDINLLDKAAIPQDVHSPKPLQTVIIAAALGFFVGVFLALIRAQLRLPITDMRGTFVNRVGAGG